LRGVCGRVVRCGTGHLDVGEDDLGGWWGRPELRERGVSGFGALDGVAFGFEHDGEELADHGVVVDDQNAEGLGGCAIVGEEYQAMGAWASCGNLRACRFA